MTKTAITLILVIVLADVAFSAVLLHPEATVSKPIINMNLALDAFQTFLSIYFCRVTTPGRVN